MDEITVQAPAKLNLTLDVLGRRADGYHDLKMVMQSITLADRLTLRPGQVPGIQVSSSFHFLPTGEKNLAGKAAVCFYQALGQTRARVRRNGRGQQRRRRRPSGLEPAGGQPLLPGGAGPRGRGRWL